MAAGSITKVDYALRPAKTIERRMIEELLRRFSRGFTPTEHLRYIGFGGIAFSDFILFHKALGFSQMISIEEREAQAPRFEFNRPFSCVDVVYGTSNQVLPRLPWRETPTVVWLDYDDALSDEVLLDVRHIAGNVSAGSMLFLSLNVHTRENADEPAVALKALKEQVAEEKLPPNLGTGDFYSTGFAKLTRRVVIDEIEDALRIRNGVLPASSRISFTQLVNFRYADGAPMMTLGGLIRSSAQRTNEGACGFDELAFVSTDDGAFKVKAPVLTRREVRYLDRHLPQESVDGIDFKGIPRKDVRAYADTYRYYPFFADSDRP